MSGEKTIAQYDPVILPPVRVEEESSTPPTEELVLYCEENPLLYSLKTLLFTGPTRQPSTIIVADDKAYQEVRNEIARLLDIHDVKMCVFVQATDQFGIWYKYSGGAASGAIMGRNQNTGRFYSYSPDWFDVEEEIIRHGHMIQPSFLKKKKRDSSPSPPFLSEEEEDDYPSKKQKAQRRS